MSGPGPFDFPPRVLDGALARAGAVERALRALLRHLRRGQLGDLRRAVAHRRATHSAPFPSAQPGRDAGNAAEAGHRAPIVYLPALAWDYRVQRPQHLARALARASHPVLYVDGFLRSRILPARVLTSRGGGLYTLRMRVPGRLDPFRQPLGARAAERLAATVAAGLRGRRPAMILVQLPFWAELGRALAAATGSPLVYDRIDLHVGFPGVPREVETQEERLLRHADLVGATAGLLAERPRELGSKVLLLPNGVELAAFPALRGAPPRRADPERRVRAGYVGALGPWFDTEAVRAAAVALPDWSFRLAGRIEDPAVGNLAALPNVETPGEIPFRDVPSFLAGLDVALVPFRDLPLTRAVDPVKLYEALATGLPVVARRLPETTRWAEPLVYTYTTPAELTEVLQRAVADDREEHRHTRRAAAERESWDHRAAALLDAVAGLPAGSRIADWTG
jgi:glycosyltransferase involved in cell wall biosynthesis